MADCTMDADELRAALTAAHAEIDRWNHEAVILRGQLVDRLLTDAGVVLNETEVRTLNHSPDERWVATGAHIVMDRLLLDCTRLDPDGTPIEGDIVSTIEWAVINQP